MATVSSTAAHPQVRAADLANAIASRPLLVALAITAVVTLLRLFDPVDSDVAWQLWIAERIHAGAHLYRDIIEMNPPLWFWMAVPVERAAALLHIPIQAMLIASVGALAASALAAANLLLGHIDAPRRTLLLAYAALTMTAMPWTHTGQREQLLLIGTIPYAGLIAARRERVAVNGLVAFLIGAGAAFGFALKHYFLIAPLLLELWLAAGQRRKWRPVRPETLAIAAVGAGYLACLLVFATEFFTSIVPLIRLAYGVFGPAAPWIMVGPFAALALVTLAVCGTQHPLLRRAPFSAALVICAIAYAVAYFIQLKGWSYHAIPMLGCASLALASLLAEADDLPRPLGILAPALLALPLLLAADDEMHPALPNSDLLGAIAGTHKGETVAFIATEPAFAWSISLQNGYRFPSRYMGFWMMSAIARNKALGSPDPHVTALGRAIVSQTVDDFRCAPPKRMIIARPRPGERSFDILPYFLRDPDFAALLSHYRATSRTSFETYEQVSALPGPRSACRKGV